MIALYQLEQEEKALGLVELLTIRERQARVLLELARWRGQGAGRKPGVSLPLLARRPELGLALYEATGWADAFLQDTSPLPTLSWQQEKRDETGCT